MIVESSDATFFFAFLHQIVYGCVEQRDNVINTYLPKIINKNRWKFRCVLINIYTTD
jgi:hypothetical protein